MKLQTESLWVEPVTGSKSISNLLWASVLLLGAIGFLVAGVSSYFGKDAISPLRSQPILFTPQGLVMCFYGTGGLFLSGYLWCAIFWGVGSGYNEFDRQSGIVSVFRWGFPGQYRRIRIRCFIRDVQTIRLEMSEGLSVRYKLIFRFKNQQRLDLTQSSESLTLRQMEARAAQLAQFLQVPIESL